MHDYVAMQHASTAHRLRRPFEGMTSRAHGARWMVQVGTAHTATNEQTALVQSRPEELAVARNRRAWLRCLRRCDGHLRRRGGLRRSVLKDPKAHAPDQLAPLIAELVTIIEKVTGPERGALFLRHFLQKDFLSDEVPEAQIADIV